LAGIIFPVFPVLSLARGRKLSGHFYGIFPALKNSALHKWMLCHTFPHVIKLSYSISKVCLNLFSFYEDKYAFFRVQHEQQPTRISVLADAYSILIIILEIHR
jgi:hypothetical protein